MGGHPKRLAAGIAPGSGGPGRAGPVPGLFPVRPAQGQGRAGPGPCTDGREPGTPPGSRPNRQQQSKVPQTVLYSAVAAPAVLANRPAVQGCALEWAGRRPFLTVADHAKKLWAACQFLSPPGEDKREPNSTMAGPARGLRPCWPYQGGPCGRHLPCLFFWTGAPHRHRAVHRISTAIRRDWAVFSRRHCPKGQLSSCCQFFTMQTHVMHERMPEHGDRQG
ncbi:hypothetical protein JOF48_001953 [Arthrobacter stackebrandtii]|uniref:Uncharacterized protein n=1 Tax=Arthrobacter stackebrandtii TaxID=272161 RepID=A0ABS4YWI6_9MICC|nr:hypothetical protein [Arthrobacter stackebrandtii]